VIVGAAWNTSSSSSLNRKFVEAYNNKYGSLPDQFAAQAYAGVYIAYQALSKAPSPDNHKAIRDALAQIKGMNTVLGNFSFTDGRDADYIPVVQIVKDGKFAIFGE
jgi:branched-chain amino acid transport system substrate-binding protein